MFRLSEGGECIHLFPSESPRSLSIAVTEFTEKVTVVEYVLVILLLVFSNYYNQITTDADIYSGGNVGKI
jgi:hypothetical protein